MLCIFPSGLPIFFSHVLIVSVGCWIYTVKFFYPRVSHELLSEKFFSIILNISSDAFFYSPKVHDQQELFGFADTVLTNPNTVLILRESSVWQWCEHFHLFFLHWSYFYQAFISHKKVNQSALWGCTLGCSPTLLCWCLKIELKPLYPFSRWRNNSGMEWVFSPPKYRW